MRSQGYRAQMIAVAKWLAGPAPAFFTLPPLMLILCIGTYAQKDLGLYEAQKIYFESLFFWLYFLPLPGAYVLIAFITASLAIRFVFFSEWQWRKGGIHLSHLGVLILLIGGLFTAASGREGYLVITEGQSNLFVSDYHARELLIVKNGHVFARVPHQKIKKAQTLTFDGAPFQIDILKHCRNCEIYKREDAGDTPGNLTLHSMAQFMALRPAPLEKDEEINLYGAEIEIKNASEDQNGMYVIFEAMPQPITLEISNADNDQHDIYEIMYGKAQRALPFAVELSDFVRVNYPGTDKAKSYHSDVVIKHEDGTSWPVRIEMNKPLRYQGYTLFQSSFIESDDGNTATVLAVVENGSWLIPYLGTGLMALGLLWHALLQFGKRRRS